MQGVLMPRSPHGRGGRRRAGQRQAGQRPRRRTHRARRCRPTCAPASSATTRSIADGDVGERLRAGMTVELRGMIDALLAPAVAELNRMPDPAPARRGRNRRPVRPHAAHRRGHRPPPPPAHRRGPRSGRGHPHRDRARRLPPRTLRPRPRRRRTARRPDRALGPRLGHRRRRVDRTARHVAHGGHMLEPVVEGPSAPPYDTMRIDPVTADEFVLRIAGQPDGPCLVRTVAGAVVTEWATTTVEVTDGVAPVPPGFVLQVAIHRHGRAPATPVAALLADYAARRSRLDRRHRHDRRPRHPQPRRLRPRPR